MGLRKHMTLKRTNLLKQPDNSGVIKQIKSHVLIRMDHHNNTQKHQYLLRIKPFPKFSSTKVYYPLHETFALETTE